MSFIGYLLFVRHGLDGRFERTLKYRRLAT